MHCVFLISCVTNNNNNKSKGSLRWCSTNWSAAFCPCSHVWSYFDDLSSWIFFFSLLADGCQARSQTPAWSADGQLVAEARCSAGSPFNYLKGQESCLCVVQKDSCVKLDPVFKGATLASMRCFYSPGLQQEKPDSSASLYAFDTECSVCLVADPYGTSKAKIRL